MKSTSTFLSTGFRPFFVGATLVSITSMAIWTAMWRGFLNPTLTTLSGAQWHAHEMIYGYAMAVVAGFLLTAVRNWTGLPTLHGWPLAGLVALWFGARLSLLFGTQFISFACAFDLLFAACLIAAIAVPLVRARMWRQMGVLAKVCLMAAGNLAFYLGVFAALDEGIRWSIYGGLYLLIGLILTMGARVLPGFIERGADLSTPLDNPKSLSVASLLLFLPLFALELFMPNERLIGVLALGLALVNLRRLMLWHTIALWRKPLLWGLYVAFVFIVLGFALLAWASFTHTPTMLALHALGVGGIGMATLAMMARVSLGHTGRDVRNPPRSIGWILVLLVGAVIARVVLPLAAPQFYGAFIGVAQLLWMAAFSLFALTYLPVLVSERIDGQSG